jgi:hypothetical protein
MKYPERTQMSLNFVLYSLASAFLLQHPVKAQACYIQYENGEIRDLTSLCIPAHSSTLESNESTDEIAQETIMTVREINAVYAEVFALCSPGCRTEDQFMRELARYCNQLRHCPNSVEGIIENYGF